MHMAAGGTETTSPGMTPYYKKLHSNRLRPCIIIIIFASIVVVGQSQFHLFQITCAHVLKLSHSVFCYTSHHLRPILLLAK